MLLSICIPSYNRFEHLKEIISSISMAQSNDFELCIVDNGSDKDIETNMCIHDPRVKIFKRGNVINGACNVNTCINFGTGKYKLLLLDKDFIDGKKIDDFIEFLYNHVDICGGECTINCDGSIESTKIYPKMKNLHVFFQGRHPTGLFYKNECIEKDAIIEIHNDTINSFGYENPLAYCAFAGAYAVYNKPLVYSLLNNPSIVTKSATINPKSNNVYWLPKNRCDQFVRNLNHLSLFDISNRDYGKIANDLYKRCVKQVTVDYKNILSLPNTCLHYGIEPKKLTILEMINNYNYLKKIFLTESNPKLNSEARKIIIVKFQISIPFMVIRHLNNKLLKNSQKDNTDICMNMWKHK